MVGLGTQDDLEAARGFLEDTGVNHQLVWDQSGRSWRHFEIAIQPAAVLLAPDGGVIARYRGGLHLDEVAEQLEG